ncbi:hypothetical protein [Bradyrhizobium elkanii]|uniref:Uncharacterized protein n=1 Tax=Bradyrhizobium diazoefficiens TaxID=1355477 RepID=A0A810CS26_9BRAD|nr:hypothetical protein XF1B_47820 [Bradyrhizobium diazoefficiens]BCE48366.1 hypothetical protein XF4B_47150 [Bradyrhizobium diazoefficiens]BCE91882.1 hypothetical protein XF10B_46800 [Bradyrhizobium diazoefficiens]BCF26810.1 hypothetical protein XF14B_47620 [Bradyrhizobium diazoefficiens]
MPKTLTKLQEQIVAKVLTLHATNFVWLREGEVNSLNSMKAKQLIDQHAYGCIQQRHLTDQIKSVFWRENPRTFMMHNFHGEGWLIFDDKRYVCKVYAEADAKRVVEGLKLLRVQEIESGKIAA